MPLYNFKEQFAPYVQDGTKTHTIRAIRKYPAIPGDILHLYKHLRTPKATRLLEPVECSDVRTIFILPDDGNVSIYISNYLFDNLHIQQIFVDENGVIQTSMITDYINRFTVTEIQNYNHMYVDGENEFCKVIDLDAFAWSDGFRVSEYEPTPGCFDMFREYFTTTHGLPFIGHIISWADYLPM